MLIDIHAHLTDARYGENQAEIVDNFVKAGGGIIVDAGYDIRSSKGACENAKRFEKVFATIGIHPEKPQELDEQIIDNFKQSSQDNKCIAIGEIGLDYHYQGFDKDLQRIVFARQIKLSDELGLPFVVHSRDASSDVLQVLTENKQYINRGFLMHCYSESAEQAQNYLKLGAYFSFGGVTTFKNAAKDKIIASIPMDRILCETDSPYLTPEPFRGKTNQPSYVEYVYQKLEKVLCVSQQKLEEIVFENSLRLFPKIKLSI